MAQLPVLTRSVIRTASLVSVAMVMLALTAGCGAARSRSTTEVASSASTPTSGARAADAAATSPADDPSSASTVSDAEGCTRFNNEGLTMSMQSVGNIVTRDPSIMAASHTLVDLAHKHLVDLSAQLGSSSTIRAGVDQTVAALAGLSRDLDATSDQRSSAVIKVLDGVIATNRACVVILDPSGG